MNTIVVQLNDKQHLQLLRLLSDALSATDDREAHAALADLGRAVVDTKAYLWTSGCGHLELEIPAEAVEDIARQGDNQPAVKAWLEGEETNYLRAQVERIDHNDIRTYLTEAGIDEVREKSLAECRSYLLWMACWDIHEERNQED